MNVPVSRMGQAVRTAIEYYNTHPVIDRAHLETLRAAALRLDTCEAEETALRANYAEAVNLLGMVSDAVPPLRVYDALLDEVALFNRRINKS